MVICLAGDEKAIRLAENLLDEESDVYILYFQEEEPDMEKHKKLHFVPWSYDSDFSLKGYAWEAVDYCIIMTENDERNILWASILKEKGAKCSLAQINDYATYRKLSKQKKEKLVDEYFNETQIMAKNIDKYFIQDSGIPGETFGERQLEVFRYTLGHQEEMTGVPIAQIKDLENLLIVSVYRNNEFFVPNGSTILANGDKLYIMGKKDEISTFRKKHVEKIQLEKKKQLWILGDGLQSINLAEALEERGYEIKLTLPDKNYVTYIRKYIPDIFIDYAPLTELKTYEQEGENYTATICASESDDKNVLMALLANHSGQKQIVTVLEKADYAEMTEGLPITLQLRPNIGVATYLMRKFQSRSRISIYLMWGGTTEIIEVIVEEGAPSIGQSLKELNLPQGVIIGGIIRQDGEVIIPNGKTEIKGEDRLVIFCSSKEREIVSQLIDHKKNKGFFSELLNLY